MSAAVLRALGPYLIGAAVIVAVLVGVRWYGVGRYDDGVAAERAATLERQARVERAMQEERDRADANYRGAVLARQQTEAALAASERDRGAAVARIDGLLKQLAQRRAAVAATGSGSDGAGADWIGIFGECVARAESLGRRLGQVGGDAARFADQVTGLQGYVRALGGAQSGP